MENLPRDRTEYCEWWSQNTNVPYGYCWCGCGLQTSLAPHTNQPKPWFRGEPVRYIHGHNSGKGPHSVIQYIEEDRGYTTPCWIWQKGEASGGYGRLSVNRRTMPVHRYFYEKEYGPVPEGKELDHLCRVRLCCRPTHVEPVTRAENLRRGARAKLSPDKAELIRQLAKSGLYPREIAVMFDVHRTTIGAVIQGKSWTQP